ncbi:MAG: hypothetical protein OXI60_07970 [Acidiferrobacterales bacterium]|nr:hypothetical protein [Acidiferrobacterales bacterium]
MENQMLNIRYKSTLFEYDGPQVFEARDRIGGGRYIAVAVEDNGTDCQYLVVGTEVEKLRKFRTGEMDLRSLIVDSSQHGWYLTLSDANKDEPVTIQPQYGSLHEQDNLPEPDFFLHDSPATNTLIAETRSRDNSVVQVASSVMISSPKRDRGFGFEWLQMPVIAGQ